LLLCVWACARSAAEPPPPPDYARADGWAAWPGRPSGADTIPPGMTDAALPEDQKADVFFIHPTTYLTGGGNARYDEPGLPSTQIDQGVLRFQASAFNACCRIYAPHYRQAGIAAFTKDDDARAQAAFQLAYADVLRAFNYYLAHQNRGRPFIIASHSQGSLHALRLLQERIAGQPLQQHLVAAYVVGYFVPLDIERAGLPVCRFAAQTGCVLSWNTVKAGASENLRKRGHLIWLDGRYQHLAGLKLVCVNPLNWTLGGTAPAPLNLGALPGVGSGAELRAPVPQLTGATCDGAALQVSVPLEQRLGFADALTLFGSYHIFDYNLFYTNIRVNAKQRVMAYRAAQAN
jgi:hypothetical protein